MESTAQPTGQEGGDKPPSDADRFDLSPSPEGQQQAGTEQPASGTGPQPAAWDAGKWEGFGQSVVSAATHGKQKPALPDGVKAEDAPADLRPLLKAMGYIAEAEGQKPAEDKAAPIAAADITAQADELFEDERDLYESDRESKLEEAATAEERQEARQTARQESVQRLINVGLGALTGAGFDLPEDAAGLYKALDTIFGRRVPREELTQRAAARFAAECRLTADRKVKGGPDVEAAVKKARAEERAAIEKYLTDVAERQNGKERIERGDLVTAAGAGGGRATSVDDEIRAIDVTTPEGLKKFREREQEFRQRIAR